MRSRRFPLLVLALASLWFSEALTTFIAQAQVREEEPASGALSPAPINATFDAEVEDFVFGARDSTGEATGEPPGWNVERGLVLKDKEERAEPAAGEDFALLAGEDATLVSSAFTVDANAKQLKFSYRLFGDQEKADKDPPPEATPTETEEPTQEPTATEEPTATATPAEEPTEEPAEGEPTAETDATPGDEDATPDDAVNVEEEGATPEPEPSETAEPEPEASEEPRAEETAEAEAGEEKPGEPLPETGLQVYLLSGDGFAQETLAFEDRCACGVDWRDAWIDVSAFAGQNVQLRFVRTGDSEFAVGVDDVATNLAEAKIGRHRSAAFAGDPVDTTTGNFTETYVDIPAIPGKGVPLGFARTYNSDTTYSGALGPKWTHTYNMSVTSEANGSKTVRYADGSTANFAPTEFYPSPPVFDAASSAESPIQLYDYFSWSHTTTTAANRLLLVGAFASDYHQYYGGVTNVTYGGQGLTLLDRDQDYYGGELSVWYLWAPASGTNTVRTYVAQPPNYQYVAIAMTFANVDQTQLASNNGGSLTATLNDLFADFVGARTTGESPGSGQTLRGSEVWGTGGANRPWIGASTIPGAPPSMSMGWSGGHDGYVMARLEGTGGTLSGPQTFNGPSGNYDKLVWDPSSSTYTLTTRDQIRYTFNSSGKLVNIKDRNNNTTTLTYSGNNLISVKDHANRTLTFTYSGARIASVTDPLSRTVTYNTSGDLTSVSHLLGGSTTYTYSTTGNRLLTQTDPNGNLVFENTYSTAGRVYKQKRIHNGSPVYTCFKYGAGVTNDSDCPAVTPAPTSGQTIVVDPLGNKTKYSYDSSFRTTQIVDALAGVSSFTYDASSNLKCVTDQLSRKTAFAYDASGNLTEVIDPLNTTTSCTLKSGGKKTTTAYNAKNDPTLITDKLGRKVQYTYNGAGNLTQVDHKDASNAVKLRACFTVDGSGLVTAETRSTTLTNCTGNTTKYEYDAYGNVTAIVDPRFSAQGTPPKTIMTYDLGGRVLTATNELGQTATTTYNALGQALTVTDNLDNTTTYTYDTGGRKTSVTDPLDNTITFTYDSLNRLVEVEDALDETTTYTYDANDNRLTVTNARGKVSEYTYDALNRLETSTDPLDRSASLEYDAASRIVERTDARDLVTKYFYDAADRLTSVEYWDDTTLEDEVDYEYDEVGNRTEMDDATGVTSYIYDALNRVTSVTFPGPKTVSYTYDNTGNRSRITYPDSKYVDYAYDESNRLVSVADWLSNETTYDYNAAGSLTTTTYPDGTDLTSVRTYDDGGRLESLVNAQGSTVYSSFEYTLDARGFRTGVATHEETQAFEYDDLGRLTEATFTPGSGGGGGGGEDPIPTDGLQMWLEFDEDSGTTASDSSGNSNDGTLTGGATWSPTGGKYGGAISLDGTNDWVDIPNQSYSGDFTVGAWVKLSGSISEDDAIVGQEGSGQDVNFYDSHCRFYDPVEVDVVIADTSASAGTWIHCAIVRSGSTVTLYINGSPEDTGSTTEAFTPKAAGRGNEWFMQGLLDDLVIYDRALSSTEIEELVNHTTGGGGGGSGGFPTAPVLDTFNRSNGVVAGSTMSSAGDSWDTVAPYYLQGANVDIVSNQAVVDGSDNAVISDGQYSRASDDVEVYITVVDEDDTDYVGLHGMITNPGGGSGKGYGVYWQEGGNIDVIRLDPGDDEDVIDAFDAGDGPADGDEFGVRFKADGDIEVYVNGDLVGTANDDTYDSGAIGLQGGSAGVVFDDFGGGEVDSGSGGGGGGGGGGTPEVHTYSYDAVGNRTSWNSNTYAYDDADQLTSGASVSFGYDANGNQVSRGSDSFTWDHENRLTAATIASTTWSHEYNGDGLRMSRGDGTTTVDYVWDVAAGLPLLLQDGTHTYVYGLGLIAIYDGTEMTYRLVDGLGSTVNLCDESGALVGEYMYDAYGNVRSQEGAETEFSFAGEQSDPNGLDYLRARYYDPEIGRFLGRDAAGQGANHYAYALNNPANLVDPSGLWTVCLGWRSVPAGDSWETYCMLTREVDAVFTNQAVFDKESARWVPPFSVQEWEEGDLACTLSVCVGQIQNRTPPRDGSWSQHKPEPDPIDWLVQGIGDGPPLLAVCDELWQENLGSFSINSSGCNDITWALDPGVDWCAVGQATTGLGIAWGLLVHDPIGTGLGVLGGLAITQSSCTS